MRNFVIIGNTLLTDEGQVLSNIHAPQRCINTTCVIHNPSFHHMHNWPLYYRSDRGMFERICDHGVGHPDPDQFQFWKDTGRAYNMTHGCDRCCKGWGIEGG